MASSIRVGLALIFLINAVTLGSNPDKEPLQCQTPPSIMLHSDFGAWRMNKLAEQIIADGYITMTYRQVRELWDQGSCAPDNALLVSIDDLSGAWLRSTFVDMIDAFLEHELVLTLGIVSVTPDVSTQDPEIWDYFKQIDKQGIEIASHSTHHFCPTWLSQEELEVEFYDSHDLICEYLGRCPETLILPFGNGWDDPNVIETASHRFKTIVSIVAPLYYSGEPLLMKRMPPPGEIGELKTFLNKHFLPPNNLQIGVNEVNHRKIWKNNKRHSNGEICIE